MANTSYGAQGLLQVINLKRSEIIALLLKHGVVISPGDSDISIAAKITDLCKTSKSFYNAFMKLLLDKSVVKTMYQNADGFSNLTGVTYTPTTIDWNSATNVTPSTSTNTAADSASSGGSKWLTEGLNLLQTSFNGYLQLDNNKTKRALADASVQVTQAGGNTNGNATMPIKSNTGLYVGLSILGISVVGLIVFLVIKANKNKA